MVSTGVCIYLHYSEMQYVDEVDKTTNAEWDAITAPLMYHRLIEFTATAVENWWITVKKPEKEENVGVKKNKGAKWFPVLKAFPPALTRFSEGSNSKSWGAVSGEPLVEFVVHLLRVLPNIKKVSLYKYLWKFYNSTILWITLKFYFSRVKPPILQVIYKRGWLKLITYISGDWSQ